MTSLLTKQLGHRDVNPSDKEESKDQHTLERAGSGCHGVIMHAVKDCPDSAVILPRFNGLG